jgi:hypothetical protein
MNKERMIEIYSGTLWEAEMIKSLLESAEIDSYLRNSVLSSYAFEPIRSESVKVMISDSNLQRAQEIIDDYNKSK